MTLYLIIGGLTIFIFAFIFFTYNSLIKLSNKVKEAFSTMDVYLKKRWDLIPNIVEVVKGYSEYEKNTLESIIALRSRDYDSLSSEEKMEASKGINNCISKLMILAENYPELKASQSFLDLSSNLTRIEDEIANSRKYYNAVVRIFNNKVEMFPSNLVANGFGYTKQNMFEATKEERENVQVKLS